MFLMVTDMIAMFRSSSSSSPSMDVSFSIVVVAVVVIFRFSNGEELHPATV
jgi:hypothetical protein